MVKDLKDKLSKLPKCAGVYIMLDKRGEVIYVGKAKILKNRVRQYFHSSKNLTDKVIAMVNKIDNFYYYVTKTESDALVLEANLIKKYKPQYNILLKDDKNYPYIVIDRKKDFPKVEVTRKLKKDGKSYFGPFFGGVSINDLQRVLVEAFKIVDCDVNFNKIPKNFRPCLNYQIHKCDAPCLGKITKKEYNKKIEGVIRFLKGDVIEVKKSIENKMEVAAEEERFERAIEYRNMLKIIDRIKEKKLTALPKNVDIDIFTFESDGINRVINQLIIRQGRMQGGQNYSIVDYVSNEGDILSTFIFQYYQNAKLPDEVLTTLSEESRLSLYEALYESNNKRFNLITPKQGMRKGLIEMSIRNGENYLEKFIDKMKIKYDMTVGSAELLSKYLGMNYIKRMECYDISNIQGVDKVASMVVFINGEKERKHYRRFKIKTIEGANDFASMQEVLTRRLTKLHDSNCNDESFSSRPDLIVVDGGKGQFSSAEKAMDITGEHIPLIGLAKRNEEIIVPWQKDSLVLPKRDNALKMLIRIRDESHRFAITYFRSLHNKNSLLGQLEKIEGIGKKKRQGLFDEFMTVSKIKQASIKELMKVNGVGKALATTIYNYFNNTKEEEKK